MLEKIAKIIKRIAKLEEYHIISEEKDYILLGYRHMMHQAIPPNEANVFSGNYRYVNKKIPIFFMIASEEKGLKNKIVKDFKGKDLPVLFLRQSDSALSIDSFRELLNKFIYKEFQSN